MECTRRREEHAAKKCKGENTGTELKNGQSDHCGTNYDQKGTPRTINNACGTNNDQHKTDNGESGTNNERKTKRKHPSAKNNNGGAVPSTGVKQRLKYFVFSKKQKEAGTRRSPPQFRNWTKRNMECMRKREECSVKECKGKNTGTELKNDHSESISDRSGKNYDQTETDRTMNNACGINNDQHKTDNNESGMDGYKSNCFETNINQNRTNIESDGIEIERDKTGAVASTEIKQRLQDFVLTKIQKEGITRRSPPQFRHWPLDQSSPPTTGLSPPHKHTLLEIHDDDFPLRPTGDADEWRLTCTSTTITSLPMTTMMVGEIRKQICSEDPSMASINDMWEYWRLSLQDDKVIVPSLTSVCYMKGSYIDWVFAYFIKDIKLPDGREFDQEHITSFLNHLEKYYCMFKAKTDKQIIPLRLKLFDHCSKAYESKIMTICNYRRNEIEMEWELLLDLEMNLWNKNVFGTHSAGSLALTVYFYMMKMLRFPVIQLFCLKTKYVSFGSNMLGKYVEVKYGKTYRHYNDPSNPRSFYQLIQTYMPTMQTAGLAFEVGTLFSKLKALAGPRFFFYSKVEIRNWIKSKMNLSGLGGDNKMESEKYLQKCKLLDPPSDLDLRISSLGNVLKFQSIQELSSEESYTNHDVVQCLPCSTDVEKSIDFICTRDNKIVNLVCSGNKVIDFACSMNPKKSHTISFDREACTTELSEFKSNDEFCCAAMRDTLVIVSKCFVIAIEKIQRHYFRAGCNVAEEFLQGRVNASVSHTGSPLEEQLEKLTLSNSVSYPVYIIRHRYNIGHIVHIKKEVTEQCGKSGWKLRGVIPDENKTGTNMQSEINQGEVNRNKDKETMRSKQSTLNGIGHVVRGENKKNSILKQGEFNLEEKIQDKEMNSMVSYCQREKETNNKSNIQYKPKDSDADIAEEELSLEEYLSRFDGKKKCKDGEISHITGNILPENTTMQPNELDPLSFTDSDGFATRVEIKKEVEDLTCEVEDRNNQPQWGEPNKKRKLDEENQLSEPYLEIKVEVEDYLPDANALLIDKRNDTCPLPPTQIISEPQIVEIKTEVEDYTISCDNSVRKKRNIVDALCTAQNVGTIKTVDIKNGAKPIKPLDMVVSSPLPSIDYSCLQPLPQNIQTKLRQTIQTFDTVAKQTLICEQTHQHNIATPPLMSEQTHLQNVDLKTSVSVKEDISNSIKETQTHTNDEESPEVYIDVDHN